MALGPVMVDLAGTVMDGVERDRLRHPLVGGVILFSRNYASPEQLRALVESIHALREPRLLVAVDQEGGPVQRFRSGFTTLPALARLGQAYDRDRPGGLEAAREIAWLMAAELRAVGVDFSFAPVLDLGRGISGVIGERAFHAEPEAVSALGQAAMRGLREAGMAAVGKHFPGHGSVAPDSHRTLPVDPRDYVDVAARDLVPFARLIEAGLPAIMPAHVVWPAVDTLPAGFSRRWLQGVLRGELEFQGCVFSDDLSMEGAAVAGGLLERAEMALEAGCDMVLLCNCPGAAERVLDTLRRPPQPLTQARLIRMHARHTAPALSGLREAPRWQRARALIAGLDPELSLDLGDDPAL